MIRRSALALLLPLLAAAAAGAQSPLPSQPPPTAPPAPSPVTSDGREFRIEGNETFSGMRLRAELGPWLEDLARTPDDPGTRDDVAWEVVQFYRKNGFPEASATLRDQPGPKGDAVVLAVVEGPRAFLLDISLIGNRALEDALLQGVFPWPRAGILPGSRAIFTDDAVDAGVTGIQLLYSLDGYLGARVTTRIDRQRVTPDVPEGEDPETFPATEFLVRIVVDVEEGERTTIEELEITPGATVDALTLRQLAGVEPGDPVTPRLAVEVRGRLQRRLADLGFYLARVTADLVETAPHRRRLVASIEEGPVHTFGGIEVTGNARTRSGFIRDRLGIAFGDRYSATALETGQRALNSTGLFERFQVTLVPWVEDPTRLNLRIDVIEQEAIRFDTRVGFSTYELGRFGLGVLHRNLFGLGIEGRLNGLVSFKGEETEGRLRYPFLFDREIALELRGKYRRYEEVSFERRETIGSVAFEFPTTRRLTLTTGFELRDEIIGDVEDVQVTEIAEDSRAHVIFLGGRYDARDSPLDPTRGQYASGRLEYSDRDFGSDFDFIRPTLRASHTESLGEEWRVVLAGQVGGIERLDDGEVPIGERFFLGGPRSVRSYRQDRMPPLDDSGDPIGGEAFAAGSIEVRREVWGDFSLATFLDAGSVTTEIEEFAGRNWRFGTGLGVIWGSPVGPLRFDWGIGLNPEKGEDHWAIHILIGQPF